MLRKVFVMITIAAVLAGCSSDSEVPASSSAAVSSRSSGNDVNRDLPIKTALEQLTEVREAAVIVTGNTAIIGIKPEGEPGESEALAIKRRIERQVKAVDGGIDHVAISTSPGLYKKIAAYNGN